MRATDLLSYPLIAVIFLVQVLLSPIASAQEGPFYPEDGPFYFSNDFAAPANAGDAPLKVVSYNLNFSPNPPVVAEELLKLEGIKDADIILLQEVTGPVGGKGNAAELIAKQLKLNYFYSPGMVFRGRDYGNAILSRYPLSKYRKYNLPISSIEPGLQRTAVEAELEIGGRRYQAMSIHLSVKFRDVIWPDSSRAKQMESALSRMRSRAGTRAIVGGDFNTFTPRGTKKLFATLKRYGFESTMANTDWTMRYLHFRLDHVYAKGGFARVADGVEYDAKASDHVPIWTLIEPRDR